MNYVLYGEEQFRLKKTLQTIIKEYIADGDELNTRGCYDDSFFLCL